MTKFLSFSLSGVCILIGFSLFFTNVDRKYISLPPNDDTPLTTILTSDHVYAQTFLATRPTLSCLSLWFKSNTTNLVNDQVTITVTKANRLLGTQTISTPFIDSKNSSRVCFSPALITPVNEEISFNVSVPPRLDNQISLKQKASDNTFAYEVSYNYHPPLAWQLGGLLIIAAAYIFHLSFSKRFFLTSYALATSFLFIAPALILGHFPLTTFLWPLIALPGLFLFLRSKNFELLPSLFGAHLFAFTAWLPLDANPTIGVIPGLFAFLGLMQAGRRHWHIALLGLAGAIFTFFPPLAFPHLFIILSFSLSFFAAAAFQNLQTYLKPYAIAPLLLLIITYIILLDLWQVAAHTLESNIIPVL